MTQTVISPPPAVPRASVDTERSDAEAEVLRQLRGIRFGQVSILIHDARIVQIERTEKLRFEPRAADPRR